MKNKNENLLFFFINLKNQDLYLILMLAVILFNSLLYANFFIFLQSRKILFSIILNFCCILFWHFLFLFHFHFLESWIYFNLINFEFYFFYLLYFLLILYFFLMSSKLIFLIFVCINIYLVCTYFLVFQIHIRDIKSFNSYKDHFLNALQVLLKWKSF